MIDRESRQDMPDRSANRRHQVLDAASVCFRQKGFHGASMAEIARVAGMSVGHIYHYFENKEAIITAIVENDVNRIQGLIANHQNATDTVESMVNDIDFEAECLNHDNTALQVEILAEAGRSPKVAAIARQADKVLCEEFRKLVQRCGSDERVEARTELISALFEGITFRSLRRQDLDFTTILPLMKGVIRLLLTDKVQAEPQVKKA
ncbi:TetR/AcrR family transcriptional regulator [Paludibacterium yongneupense]|uniref:TetR/AcrR family transcriptional regulator n=1 Tax=Paludibacterium yongneupense TaxID=400061 RepID=UPI00048CEDCE|nr:TetR/AcrR family transcriptional regulator [Paludibacterium yongneupense]